VAAQAGPAIVTERRRREREQSERLADMGRMLSGVIHDLRTPMTLISGYGQLMAGCDDAGERAGHAARIERQLELMSAMIRDVLAFARGERTLLVRKVMLPRFVEEVRTHLERALEGSGVRLELELRHRGAARFDETRLFRVFHNVACNARDAMPGGGRLRITVLAEGGQLVTHFDDDGPGVLPEVRDRLFEPFATAGKVGGTGLGLAMVRQIAEEHGGSVTLAEAPLGGARFTVRLPLGL
jgi:signal transduction histidine kinase